MSETLQDYASRRVPVRYVYPDSLVTQFSGHFVAQFQPDHFFISFFEIFPPPLMGDTEEEKLAAIKEIKHLDAKCVARIVMTPTKLRELINLLTENLSRYEQAMSAKIE